MFKSLGGVSWVEKETIVKLVDWMIIWGGRALYLCRNEYCILEHLGSQRTPWVVTEMLADVSKPQ